MTTSAERYRSVSAGADSREIGYVVKEATDDIDAQNQVWLDAPLTYGGLSLETVRVEEIRWPDIWDATAVYTYKKLTPAATDDLDYSFDFSLGSQKVFQSLSTTNQYVASGLTTDYKGAIAVDIDGAAHGIDIMSPQSSFSYTWYPANASVTATYQRTVQQTVGKVNSTTFKGYPAGEVIFTGASGRSRNNKDWEISYSFAQRNNQTGLTIGGISAIAVDGWDVLWVKYGRDTDNNRYIQKPIQVNVERVYERADLATVLGI